MMENKLNIPENELEDDFLQKRIDKSILMKPSENFTNTLMDKVMQEWINNPVVEKKKNHSIIYWIFSVVAILIGGSLYVATDVRKLIKMSDISWLKDIDYNYLNQLHSLYENIFSLFKAASPLVYIVISAVIAVIIIDLALKNMDKFSTKFYSI